MKRTQDSRCDVRAAQTFRPAPEHSIHSDPSAPGLESHKGRTRVAGLKPGTSTTTFCLAITLLSILFWGLSALAQQGKEAPLPKDLPPYGQTQPFTPPHVQQEKLPNGLTLWLVPEPGFPKVAFAAVVRGGMASDPAQLPGISELLADTVNQGTRTRTARQIAEEFQAAGGDFSANAEADALTLSAEVLTAKAEPALTVLADVLQNATFPESEVELARRNQADSLRAREAEPQFLASRALAQAAFGNHPYHVIASTQAALAQMTAAELRQIYTQRFRPDQALLVVVGDFDAAKMSPAVRAALGNWKAPVEAAVATVPPPPAETPHAVFFVPRAGSVQTTFIVGMPGPTRQAPDYAQARVANAIYGGMFGSRLIRNIREDKGYTYSPFAFLQTLRLAGLAQTHAAVRNEVTGASYNEIQYELNRMATTEPATDEVQRAQRYLVGNRAISLQSRAAVAGQLGTLWVDGLPPEELGLESERVQKVTPEQVEQVARKYLPASRATVIAVGEAKVIEQQLAPFGLKVQQISLPDQTKP